MKKRLIILALVILLLLSQVGYSNTRIWTIVNGNAYLERAEASRATYFAGLFDMWNYMYSYAFPYDYKIIHEEIKDMLPSQVRKIFEKYLENNPENLHWPSAQLFDLAMNEVIFEGQ